MSNRNGSNLDEYGFERYEENAFPIAYLLTWRTFGTWLHGHDRQSMQRSRDKRTSTFKVEPSVPLVETMEAQMKRPSVKLTAVQRDIVPEAIAETCKYRQYVLRAANVRTNHAHVVASAAVKPEKMVNDLKAYATRALRERGAIRADERVWSRGASTRYLWKPASVEAAIEYVLYSQGDVPFDVVTDITGD